MEAAAEHPVLAIDLGGQLRADLVIPDREACFVADPAVPGGSTAPALAAAQQGA